MDVQFVLNIVFTGLISVGIFVLRTIFAGIKEARDAALIEASKAKETAVQALAELGGYRTHVAENYVSVRRFDGFEERLFGELKAIKDRLDEKADK